MKIPQWYDVYSPTGEKMGSILLSFNIFGSVKGAATFKAYFFHISTIKRPQVEKFNCEIFNYGFRNLKSSGIMNPRKPYLKLFLKSLSPPEHQASINDIMTAPVAGGANPTFATKIKFSAMMPSHEVFAPSLQCAVYDNLLFGLSQPLIGNMFIPLGLIYKLQNEIRKNELYFEEWVWNQLHPAQAAANSLEPTAEEPAHIDIEALRSRLLGVYDISSILTKMDESTAQIVKTCCGIHGGEFPTKTFDDTFLEKLIIMPSYEIDPVTKMRMERNVPDPNDYVPIGYDPKPDSKIKHYRYIVKKELESIAEIMPPSPFTMFKLTRGLSGTLFSAKKFDVPEQIDAGVFKGWVSIKTEHDEDTMQSSRPFEEIKASTAKLPPAEKEKLDGQLEHYEKFKLDNMFKTMEKELVVKQKAIVRLYVIDAFGLRPKDINSHSDPYLHIELGDKIIDEKDKFQSDTSEPKFYSVYELITEFPTTSTLKIKVYDNDFIGSDLIGETVINLEDRFYSTFWRQLPQKPIEIRQLYNEESAASQGSIRLWVDIFKMGEEKPAFSINPQPDAVFLEVRKLKRNLN